MTRANDSGHGPRGAKVSALAKLPVRMPHAIVEREILRVVGTIPSTGDEDPFAPARSEILKWAARRAGQPLPSQAWNGGPFEILAAGRTTLVVNIATEASVLWSIRGDDPDKTVPGRVWSTEVTLGQKTGEDILLGVRLLVNSAEAELRIVPAVPGLVLQIADKCRLLDGDFSISPLPRRVENENEVGELIDWLSESSRKLPVIVASGDERTANPQDPLLDVDELAKRLCGLAHVAVIPAHLTYLLSDAFGKSLSTFYGAVRIYNPGFDHFADPFDHRLYLSQVIVQAPAAITEEIQSVIARDSLRRTRLGHDIVPFATIRSTALRIEQEQQARAGASEGDQLAAAMRRSDALENENKALLGQVDQAFQLSEDESARADSSEKQLYAAWARIENLEAAFAEKGGAVVDEHGPDSWDGFATWCDNSFASRLSLAPAARRGTRKPDFEDVNLAARCIRWLAHEARSRFLTGGGSLANVAVLEGVQNAPCGNDEYGFDFQGRRLIANWHIKNGGNTRQPERCLRIYYAFDEVSRQIVVSDMPAHRKTDAS